MHFEGEFRVPGKAADVLKRFADVPRMARCMPGAVLEPQAEDGSWPGAMVVTFGPKKINFKGKATCVFDDKALTGSVHGRGTADMRSARIGVKVSFALSDTDGSTPPETLVKIVSDAELGGVLEDFARTGGIAVANVIMADFARRASEEFARDAAPVAENASTATPEPAPLAGHSLLWIVVQAYWVKLLQAIGFRPRIPEAHVMIPATSWFNSIRSTSPVTGDGGVECSVRGHGGSTGWP